MRYTEKALRQMKGAPPHDCGEHPNTTYVRVPQSLRDEIPYQWACAECMRAKRAALEERKREERAARRKEKEREQRAIREAKAAAKEAQEALRASLGAAQQRMASTKGERDRREETARERAERLISCERKVEEARDALRAAEEALDRAREDAAEEVGGEDAYRAANAGVAAMLESAVDRNDAAWDCVTRSYTKKHRDKALSRKAKQAIATARQRAWADA